MEWCASRCCYFRDPRMTSSSQKHQFTIVVVVLQAIFMILFGLFAKYDENTMPNGSDDLSSMSSKYPMFQDTHVMIFIGFGFLMTFLKRYGFSAVSINMLLACFTIEWGMIVRGVLSEEFHTNGRFIIGIDQLLTADFAAAVVLITMGAMLGKLTPIQYLIMTLIETPIAIFIEHHVVHTFHVNDIGGSIVVHTFGAYFGLACSKTFGNKRQRDHENEGSIYHSDIYAMIGAIFLWVFWPSFNAVMAEPADARQRAVCNTFLSLCACTITTFLASQATDHHKKFDMVHIANSTLAGGVAIGTIANVVLHPLHALLIGVIAGLLSVVGYKYITPLLTSKLGIHDTCGVNNLHGMPGVLAGLLSAILVMVYDPLDYGKSLNLIYPAMRSESNADGISASSQALNQLIGLALVLVSSLTSGLLTGLLLKLDMLNQVRENEFYADGDYFETPSDYDFTTQVISRIDHIEISEHTHLTHDEIKMVDDVPSDRSRS
ncbi:putative ammonium transporter Rh type [Dictyocaulus viviparus]|uniref:Putative ammonium transporter Rh type n=1 Tax=Dictyocaulus viviparus TaxID=29172 RepID=A0A0D8Y439_DICVI|nr:putative ammonium transporter Rh type [Dictyocaulus viviparus]